jgi:hypothetical protein
VLPGDNYSTKSKAGGPPEPVSSLSIALCLCVIVTLILTVFLMFLRERNTSSLLKGFNWTRPRAELPGFRHFLGFQGKKSFRAWTTWTDRLQASSNRTSEGGRWRRRRDRQAGDCQAGDRQAGDRDRRANCARDGYDREEEEEKAWGTTGQAAAAAVAATAEAAAATAKATAATTEAAAATAEAAAAAAEAAVSATAEASAAAAAAAFSSDDPEESCGRWNGAEFRTSEAGSSEAST